ncbi:MAG: M23 family metallopeptidase [Pseudoxanthomonas sp.]
MAVLLLAPAAGADQAAPRPGDWSPPAPAQAPQLSAPTPLVRLRLQRTATRYQVWADNLVAGPVQVRLSLQGDGSGVVAAPPLPLQKLIQARASLVLGQLILADPQGAMDFRLGLDAVPGDPQAQPLDVAYRLPFDAPVRVDQGPGGHFSHDDAQNLDAIDFALIEGTPVLAARDGLVMQVEADHAQAGLDRERDAGRANFVRILHGDGSMALYAHLAPAGVLVRPGQLVRAGDRIGLSGNTGLSTAPHLHFVVQVNRGMRLVSIPVRLLGPEGELRLPDPEP